MSMEGLLVGLGGGKVGTGGGGGGGGGPKTDPKDAKW